MIELIEVTTAEERQQCFDIRKEVFVKEQFVPQEEEIDDLEDLCTHFLLTVNDKPVGTARLYPVSEFSCKIQRVAITKPFRGKGLGKVILSVLIDYAKDKKMTDIKLSAQTNALPFYEKLGFVAYGEEYMDANIPHKMMQLN